MHEGTRTGSVTCSARSVGGDAGSRVRTIEKRPPHMFPQRRDRAVHTLPLSRVVAGRDGTGSGSVRSPAAGVGIHPQIFVDELVRMLGH